jgi:hypothetical protein
MSGALHFDVSSFGISNGNFSYSNPFADCVE